MFGSAPDLLRLLVVPLFAWAAVRDVRTRRLPNRIWPPLYAFGALLLAWDAALRWPLFGFADRLFLLQVAISVLFVAPLGYAFWYFGGFGGADAKALIGLAIVFPTFPTYILPVAGVPVLPAVQTYVGVFSLTILTNTVIVGALYPVGLAIANAAGRRFSPAMLLARPVPVERLSTRHGRLLQTREGRTRRGLDLDALRMYVRWRGLALEDVRERPDRYRDPTSVSETFDPTDGATDAGPTADGGEPVGGATADGTAPRVSPAHGPAASDGVDARDAGTADPWAAERFLAEIEGTAYGTDPETLRDGLETVVARDEVWVSPGIPFVVPMFVGLVVALTYGDVLFAVLTALGWT